MVTTEMGIYSLGYMHQNRLLVSLIIKKAELQKKKRRSFEQASCCKDVVLLWEGNKTLTIVTKYYFK